MYKIHLDNFEGPIDLLLYFIRRDEIDIYDIPISDITKEFIDTIEEWEKLHLHIAGDFIVMASSLMRIKARMLLPRAEIDEEGDIIDPRTELVNQLVEYKRFKDASDMLKNLSNERGLKFSRKVEPLLSKDVNEIEKDMVLNISLYDLARTFKLAMESRPVVSPLEMQKEPVKLEQQKEFIYKYFDGDGRLRFSSILDKLKSRMEVVVTFLAILDLVREGLCIVTQDKIFGDLELQKIDLD